MASLLMLIYVLGNAPICAFDGYQASCYYYSWQECESAVGRYPSMHCIANPNMGR